MLTSDLTADIRYKLSGFSGAIPKDLNVEEAKIWLSQSWRAFTIAKDLELGLGNRTTGPANPINPPSPTPTHASISSAAQRPRLYYQTNPRVLSSPPRTSPAIAASPTVSQPPLPGKRKKKNGAISISIGPPKASVNGKGTSTPRSDSSRNTPTPTVSSPPAAPARPPGLPMIVAVPQSRPQAQHTPRSTRPVWGTTDRAVGSIPVPQGLVATEGARTFAWVALTSTMEAIQYIETLIGGT